MKNDIKEMIVQAKNIKYREEDFGILVTGGNNYFSIINNSGLNFIEYLIKVKCGKVNELVCNYLIEFKFDEDEKRGEAYNILIEFISELLSRNILGIVE